MTLSHLECYGITEFSGRSYVSDILTRKGYFVARFSDEVLWEDVASSLAGANDSHSSKISAKSGNWRAPLLEDINMLRLIICDQLSQIVAEASPFILSLIHI